MDDAPATRHTLIVKLRDPADAAAWREFVGLYEPLVYRLARHKGLQDADARDLCQDVFRAVAGAIERWDPDPARGSFRGWLFTIARNLCLNFLSRRDRHPRGSGDDDVRALLDAVPADDPAASATFDAEYKKRLFKWAADQVRDEFAPRTWQAFWQTGVESKPVAEVAAGLGMTAGAVYVARSRVLARLRQRIDQLGDETAARIGSSE
jgi:RNA polymerase sigma-70 factor (ECF subfamily)